MKENYLVNIIGTQVVNGEENLVEVVTCGDYMIKNGSIYIRYKEYDDENPEISYINTVKQDSNGRVVIIRTGDQPSRLTLEKGVRHQCHYNTVIGDISIGVFTDVVNSEFDDKGGRLFVKYSLDFNGGFASRNMFEIIIKEKEVV